MKNRKGKDVVIPGAERNRQSTVKQGKITSLTAGLPVHAGNDIKRAFTLIELLVVVLIIGILSAIALPQYNIAVNKTRFSNYRTVASSIARSVESYYLANGKWPDSFAVLDVNLPSGMSTNGTTAYGDNIFCEIHKPLLHGNYGQIRCADKEDYTLAYTHMYAKDDGTPYLQYMCSATSDIKAVCQALGGKFYIQQKNKYYYKL